jgi:uncharacterized protein (PEP-CTERM system associated)
MTITTAKLARALRQAYPLPLALSALLMALPAQAIDLDLDKLQNTLNDIDAVKPPGNRWRIVPMLDVRQIYTDNVSLQPAERAHGQFLTELAPGVLVKRDSRRLKLDGLFQLHLYANTNDKYATRRSSNKLRANARAELVDDMVFVDGSASMFQQSISPFSQFVSGNEYADVNRANVKTWQVSPYLINRFGHVARSELRYLHDSVDAGNSGMSSTTGDTLSFRLNSGSVWEELGWGISASEQKIHDPRRNDSTIRNGALNLSYRLTNSFAVTAASVYDDYDYEAIGGANGGNGWSTGFRWTPSSRTSVDASWGQRYYGPSRSLKALHRSRRTAWNISYDDSVVTSRSNFLLAAQVPTLPGGEIPAQLPGGIFNPGLPPVQVPVLVPPLGGGINFFSNRYSLQTQARAGVTLRGGRSSAVVNLFKIRREALSVRGVDDQILGSPVESVNDNIEQVGVNTLLTYNLSPRSSVLLALDASDNESLTTGFKARASAARLSLRHKLGRNIAATAELRRVSGATGLTSGARYTENALSVTLNMTL